MCVCACVYACACVYVCARVHVCVRVRVCVCVCTRARLALTCTLNSDKYNVPVTSCSRVRCRQYGPCDGRVLRRAAWLPPGLPAQERAVHGPTTPSL